jgi:hypothetical protein
MLCCGCLSHDMCHNRWLLITVAQAWWAAAALEEAVVLCCCLCGYPLASVGTHTAAMLQLCDVRVMAGMVI